MGTELSKVQRGAGVLVSRSADATDDVFVLKEMARGEPVVAATRYTQSGASCGLQIATAGVPLGIVGVAAMGSVLGGLAVAGIGMAALGALMLLETSNRVVVTQTALIVQNSVFLRRYELDRIEDPRVETLGPRRWMSFDVSILDPRFLFIRAPGLRFRYRKEQGKYVEVFVAMADADAYLPLIS